MKQFLIVAVGALSALPSVGIALAAEPSYVGRWSGEPYTCRPDETVSLTRREMHLLENGLCRFGKITGGAGRWHTIMTCEGEGSTDRVSADLVVENDLLSIVYGKPYNTTAKFKRCGAKGAGEPSTATATATDDFAGKYAGQQDSYKWSASITPAGRESYKIIVEVDSTMPECSGKTTAVGRVKAGRIVTQPDQDDSCVLTVSKKGGGIAVVEKGCSQDHGAACMFTSRMKRVGQ